ncbi:MAG: hypothetical protein HY303_19290 [Candidatus Wallbacteria bacterium]|nr:hypothetical protein [Candidatus Wallbacteria bacterium]
MDELFVISEEEEAPPPPETDHLLILAGRLEALTTVLAKKLNQAAVAHYCRLLANTMRQLAPFYRIDGLLPGGRIDRDDSGFPCTEDLYYLFSEWRAAERGLRAGVSETDLLEQMRKRIWAGEFPSEEHAALARRHHMLRIQGAEIAEDFRVLHPILLKETDTLRFYRLGWRGWDERAGLFRYCSCFFTQDKETRPLEEVRKDSPLHERIRAEFTRPLPETVETLYFRDGVHPKSVDRYTIGPYYSPGSANSNFLQHLFDGVEHPFLLKVSLERVIIESGRPRTGFLDELIGEPQERQTNLIEQRVRYVLCSREIQDRLGGTDEKGEPATIYTLDRRGRIE